MRTRATRRTRDRGEHPILQGLAALAAVVAILTFLIQFRIWPFVDGSSPSPTGGGGDTSSSITHACAAPTLSLSKGSGPSGTHVTVQGTGFPGGESVELRFHTEALAPGQTAPDGTFAVEIVVPGTFDAFAGQQFEIRATTSPTVCFKSAPFKLTG